MSGNGSLPADPDLADVVALALGGNGIKKIAERLGRNPEGLFRWISRDPARMDAYQQARAICADDWAMECVEIADECGLDEVQKATLRINTRFRLAGKIDPAGYGERQQLSGPGGGPLQIEATSARKWLEDRIAGVAARLGPPEGEANSK